MSIDLILPVSMVFGIAAWTLAFHWYASPFLFHRRFSTAMRPLLLLHGFRYVGLMFLIPGVTAEPLDTRFATPAAYGDLLTATLAFFALWAVQRGHSAGVISVLVFNVVGFTDLVNAVGKGIAFTPDGALGATFWIPALIVPLLLVTHVFIFIRLGREFFRTPAAEHCAAANLPNSTAGGRR